MSGRDDVTSGGKLFQVPDAAIGNARSPMVRRRVRGTASADVDDDRKRRRPGSSATGCRSSSHVGRRESTETLIYQHGMLIRDSLTIDHLDPPDLPRHGCNSDRGPAASGEPTVLANDRNGGRLRLNASRHDDDDDW